MTKRGLPIDKDMLVSLGESLDKDKERLTNEIRELLAKREQEKGKKFWQYDADEDGYKTLPKILREECKLRGEVVEVEKEKRRKITDEEIAKLTKEQEDENILRVANGKKAKKIVVPKTMPEMVKVMEERPLAYCQEGSKYPCRDDQYEQWFWDFAEEAGYKWEQSEWDEQAEEYVYYLVKKEEFNPGSSAQLKEYCLFMNYEIPTAIKKTNHGKETKETTDDKALEDLSKSTKDPMFRLIQDFREVSKLRSTYVEGWKPNSKDGRLHSTFTFTPATGQLSSRNPNVQNAPSHSGEFGKAFKKVVRAREGRLIVNCVAPGTKILMRDLTWKNAEEVKEGEAILGFDEELHPKTRRRYFKTSIVTKAQIKQSKRLVIETDRGNITVSLDHKFLTAKETQFAKWVEAKNLKVGQKIRYFTDPWETSDTYDAGWLAGFLDGEGYIGNGGGNKIAGARSTGLGFGQNDGYAAEKAVEIITNMGYTLTISNTRRCKQYQVISRNGKPYSGIRLIGQVRPVRLLPKVIDMVEGMATWGSASVAAVVTNIYEVEDGPVVAISTTSKTLVTNGFLSHNCDYAGFHAQMTGYFAGSLSFMRLSLMGAHDYLAAWMLRRQIEKAKPKDLENDLMQETIEHIKDLDSWLSYDDDTLRAKLKWIKKNHDHLRNKKAKPTVHGVNFGLGAKKMYEMNKDAFSGMKEAQEIKDLFFSLFPEIKLFQERIVDQAHREKKLVSPYGYVRRFWEAKIWDPRNRSMKNGEDAEKAIAFLPANTAFGIKKEAILRLEDIGANEEYCFFDEVHDSMNYEILEKDIDEALKVIYREMTRPVMKLQHPTMAPNGLVCEVEVSVGPNWKECKEVKIEL